MSNKTVIIMGAGAVRSAAGKKPVAKRPPLDCDFFAIAEKTEPELAENVSRTVSKLVGTYSSEVLKSLEDTTTLLYLKALDSANKSQEHRAFIDQIELLVRVLGRTTNDLPVGPRTHLHRFLKREIQRLDHARDLTIITFNYDLMIERVLDQLQVHTDDSVFGFPGCYRLPPERIVSGVTGHPGYGHFGQERDGVAVLKLHGSMNWSSAHTSKKPTPSALFSPRRSLYILNTSEISSRLMWTRGKKRHYMKPIILPPVTGKRGLLHRDFSGLWVEAAKALSNARRVVIYGYSCPPLDFEAKMLLGENVQPGVTKDLVMIDPNTGISSRFVPL